MRHPMGIRAPGIADNFPRAGLENQGLTEKMKEYTTDFFRFFSAIFSVSREVYRWILYAAGRRGTR